MTKTNKMNTKIKIVKKFTVFYFKLDLSSSAKITVFKCAYICIFVYFFEGYCVLASGHSFASIALL
jgi:hypothetical protein